MVKPTWESLSLGALVLYARRVANPSARHRTSLNHDCNSRGAESLLALRNEGRCVKGSGFDVPFDGWLTLQPHTSRQPKAPMEFAGAAFFAFFFSAKGATLAAPAKLCWKLDGCALKSPTHAPAPAPASSVSAVQRPLRKLNPLLCHAFPHRFYRDTIQTLLSKRKRKKSTPPVSDRGSGVERNTPKSRPPRSRSVKPENGDSQHEAEHENCRFRVPGRKMRC